jgi:hypothetical protein
MTDVFTAPDDGGDLKSSDFSTSMVDRLGAQWADTLDPKNSLSGMWLARQARQANAAGTDQAVGAGGDIDVFSGQSLEDRQAAVDARVNAIPDISQSDAKDLLKQEGLTEQDVHLGDAPTHKLPVLKMQIAEAHTRRDRQAAIERGPQGFFPDALGAVTSIGVGMIDPVNAAAFSIPVIGEARMGKIIASAGDSILARGAARFGQGAAQGALGTAVLQPADWWLHTRDGQDYTMAQAMESIIMGAGMGGAFHAVPGGVGDVLARRRGLPLAGSPQDLLLRGLMTGTHVHADQLTEEGVPLEDVPGITPEPNATEAAPQSNKDIEDLIGKVEAQLLPAEPVHPAQALADLPQAAREDAVHAAMADIISGRPTQAAQMLDIAADHDPRIAETLEAYHGSPHDFDRFDLSKIGTGEGAQAYGHGLYFAENERVARGYQRTVSDKAFVNKVAELYDEGHSPGDAWAEVKDNWKEFTPAEQRLMTALEKDDWLGFDYPHQAVSAALRDLKAFDVSEETKAAVHAIGNMYRVKIAADHKHFLDWDKPISEQAPHVRQALHKVADDIVARDPVDAHDVVHAITADESADTFYERLADALKTMKKSTPDENGFYHFDMGHATASKTLHDAGIPGIKYLDQGSRAGALAPAYRAYEEGGKFYVADKKPRAAGPFDTMKEAQDWIAGQATRNFVVFNDRHIEITHKNGEPVKREELIAEHKAQQAARKAPRGRAAADPATWSLFEHLASVGGLKPDPELRAIFGNDRGPFVPGFGPLIRKTGMPLDEALSSAKQHGYMFDAHDVENGTAGVGGRTSHGLTPNDLLDHLDAENRGQKLYKPTHVEKTKYDPEQEKHVIMGALEHELETHGASVADIDPQLLDRAVEIVHREGVSDVMEAYERAIIEDEERYNATADALRTDPETRNIPGWDAASDAGRASGDRGRHSENGREAGRSDDGARRADGQEPARAGQTGRSSPAVVAADPRWRQLADTTPDYNDPEVLAESEAADHVPEPDSLVPERSLTALEKAAADAEEVWRKLEPTLTEKERALVHDVMGQLKLDAEARSRIITDGVTCLAGAIG